VEPAAAAAARRLHFTLDVQTEESGSVRLRNSTVGQNERPGFSGPHPNTTVLRTRAVAG
jgi:hypothetical protein